jgi:phosphohistidine phosphatase
MVLLIVRHAIAMERDARRWPDDGLRPLSPRGIARAQKAAAGLRQIAARPTVVLASPLLRTRQTAQILARYAGWPSASVCDELAPAAAPGQLLALLARNTARRIAVVGHEPHLSEFLAACLPGRTRPALGLRKMGVALVSFGGRVQPSGGRLEWLAAPRILRAAGRRPAP